MRLPLMGQVSLKMIKCCGAGCELHTIRYLQRLFIKFYTEKYNTDFTFSAYLPSFYFEIR